MSGAAPPTGVPHRPSHRSRAECILPAMSTTGDLGGVTDGEPFRPAGGRGPVPAAGPFDQPAPGGSPEPEPDATTFPGQAPFARQARQPREVVSPPARHPTAGEPAPEVLHVSAPLPFGVLGIHPGAIN